MGINMKLRNFNSFYAVKRKPSWQKVTATASVARVKLVYRQNSISSYPSRPTISWDKFSNTACINALKDAQTTFLIARAEVTSFRRDTFSRLKRIIFICI
jgi:hypothetical protein